MHSGDTIESLYDLVVRVQDGEQIVKEAFDSLTDCRKHEILNELGLDDGHECEECGGTGEVARHGSTDQGMECPTCAGRRCL